MALLVNSPSVVGAGRQVRGEGGDMMGRHNGALHFAQLTRDRVRIGGENGTGPILKKLQALRHSVHGGRPYDTPEWQRRVAKRLGLESAYRPTGRPGVANRTPVVE
ncbi:MAG: hypothetical protein ACLQVM_20830 [Terriglobia bacterium]